MALMMPLGVIAIVIILLSTETRPVPKLSLTFLKQEYLLQTTFRGAFPKQTWIRGELDMLYSVCLARKHYLCRSVT